MLPATVGATLSSPAQFDTVSSIIPRVTRREKLLTAIRNNPKAVRFEDACKIAEWLGFRHKGGQGSHRAFGRPDEPDLLNFQSRNGFIPPYQARQLIKMMDKYGGQNDQIPD